MEYAIWNGKNLIASEVAAEFEEEREVRKASKRKELFCQDKDCHQPVRYCHGEIKGAYFAHLNNDSCDYRDFDRTDNPVFRNVRLKLYEHFKAQGYNVLREQKVLAHHYCQLLFIMQDGKRLAIEFGTKHTSATMMDKLTEEYSRAGIAIHWIVIGNTNSVDKENQLYYIKRYLLNKTTYQECLMVDAEINTIKQVRWDTKKYDFKGQSIWEYDIEELYSKESNIGSLILFNNELTLIDFNVDYDQWLQKKQELIDERIRQEIALKKEQEDRIGRQEQHQLQMSYEERKAEVIDRLNQDEDSVWDSTGRRWLKCKLCGKIGDDGEFSYYGGAHSMTSGVCCGCMRKKSRQ